jgi:hypothetical protein
LPGSRPLPMGEVIDDPPGHGGYGPIIAVVEKGKG